MMIDNWWEYTKSNVNWNILWTASSFRHHALSRLVCCCNPFWFPVKWMDSFSESNVIIIQRRLVTEFLRTTWSLSFGLRRPWSTRPKVVCVCTHFVCVFHARIHAVVHAETRPQPWTNLLDYCNSIHVRATPAQVPCVLWLLDSFLSLAQHL